MGGGATLITCSGGKVTYQDEHKKISANSASSLMKQQTGVSLPVESLYYWARGLPAPSAPVSSSSYGPQKQLLQLKQSGYTLNYSDYKVFHGYRLPNKILLEGQGVRLKLVIKSWSID
ncbi:MAG: outer membrane lipoprotein LolB [Legionellales bacterium RIFCSPHIGHO2_12_FULL_37_14]|nr:MAG: outer membrane lipoprotein LolB [Legionellales bacterium RIFCSPHIGHO2_12_FULL_37_14]